MQGAAFKGRRVSLEGKSRGIRESQRRDLPKLCRVKRDERVVVVEACRGDEKIIGTNHQAFFFPAQPTIRRGDVPPPNQNQVRQFPRAGLPRMPHACAYG